MIFLFFYSSLILFNFSSLLRRAHRHHRIIAIQGQFTEEQILDNNENSPMFEEFLQLLGDKVRLRGFDKYKGGLGEIKIKREIFLSVV